jgi:hypothetical protein
MSVGPSPSRKGHERAGEAKGEWGVGVCHAEVKEMVHESP